VDAFGRHDRRGLLAVARCVTGQADHAAGRHTYVLALTRGSISSSSCTACSGSASSMAMPPLWWWGFRSWPVSRQRG